MIEEEKIFPILNKLDRIWQSNLKMRFCDMYRMISEGKKLSDSQLSKRLTDFIDKNNIK